MLCESSLTVTPVPNSSLEYHLPIAATIKLDSNVVYKVVDLGLLYPAKLTPSLITTIRGNYIASYHDRNFIDPPGWFLGFIWMEACYHVPLSIWALGALLRGMIRLFFHSSVLSARASAIKSEA